MNIQISTELAVGAAPALGDFAVCLDHVVDGRWLWRLIDLDGAAAASGAELTQGEALQAAATAARSIAKS
ncbi:MAG: hypothetical protein IT546_11840 [Caulobacteraceae bacterium]|nr:hypothetical protein [Caulobacteraceae bacterium]